MFDLWFGLFLSNRTVATWIKKCKFIKRCCVKPKRPLTCRRWCNRNWACRAFRISPVYRAWPVWVVCTQICKPSYKLTSKRSAPDRTAPVPTERATMEAAAARRANHRRPVWAHRRRRRRCPVWITLRTAWPHRPRRLTITASSAIIRIRPSARVAVAAATTAISITAVKIRKTTIRIRWTDRLLRHRRLLCWPASRRPHRPFVRLPADYCHPLRPPLIRIWRRPFPAHWADFRPWPAACPAWVRATEVTAPVVNIRRWLRRRLRIRPNRLTLRERPTLHSSRGRSKNNSNK